MPPTIEDSVHPNVRRAAAWAWRILILLTLGFVLLWIIYELEVIVIPVAIALLVSALLVPSVDWLAHHHLPRALAVCIVIITTLTGFILLVTCAVNGFLAGIPALADHTSIMISSTEQWLINSPLHLQRDQLDKISEILINALRHNAMRVTRGALDTAKTLTEILTGTCIMLFTLIFFLYDGRHIWSFFVSLFPTQARKKIHDAGIAGFHSLVGYVRATCVVAFADATGVSLGLSLLHLPLVLPLGVLIFVGAFIPLVGAVTTGLLAVIVALVFHGWLSALSVLGILLGIEQIESHILQPLVMGRAVKIHPLAVVLGIATGAVLAGIIGALLAVPTIAFTDRALRVLMHPDNYSPPLPTSPTPPIS